jgi:hypothetical protein
VRPTALIVAAHAVIGVTVFGVASHAQRVDAPTTIVEVSLPGGLKPALAAIGDPAAPDRAQFLLEFIHRIYDAPLAPRSDPRERVLQSLLSAVNAPSSPTGAPETVPLPLTVPIWTDVIFGGKATPQTLVSSIVQSRSASLLYCALLSLDDETRAWLATQPGLMQKLAAKYSGAFLAAAPALRITAGSLRLPGGDPAIPVWRALVGKGPADPVPFVEALLEENDGRLAQFAGALSSLTTPEIGFALDLTAPDVEARIERGRRLYSLFARAASSKSFEHYAFTRPPLDPVLLVAELEHDASGVPRLPGTREFWGDVFSEANDPDGRAVRAPALVAGEPVDFAWLSEQVFRLDSDQRRRYTMVLFASRRVHEVTRLTVVDAVEAIRSVGAYPALAASLERAGVTDVAAFAAAARRAAALSAIGDSNRGYRALAQFQGALALVTRAASRGSVDGAGVTGFVSALSAIPISDDGDYEGRIVCWLTTWLRAQTASRPAAATSAIASAEELIQNAAGPIEQLALRLLAGRSSAKPTMVEWEGTRYRVDPPRAEAQRIVTSLGPAPRPYLTSAETVVAAADTLAAAGLTRDRLQQIAGEIGQNVQDDAAQDGDREGRSPLTRERAVVRTLQRTAREGKLRAAARLAPALRLLADELLARGLIEFAYAAALGERDGFSIPAAEAAGRHDFGFTPALAPVSPWRPPVPGTDGSQRWRVSGSLLGLDVGLAEFSLVRLSFKQPARPPMLPDSDRRAFVESVALVKPAALLDADRDAIAAALRNGREIVARARTAGEIGDLADRAGLSGARRSLLPWVIAHDPTRVSAFLSPAELLWVGAPAGLPDRLDAWGAPAAPHVGCLCLQMVERRPWDMYAGRWNSAMIAGTFPDLNLRLAELLSELRMPAALLGSVLTAATLDFINSAVSRNPDDRRGLTEFVAALRAERVERYLALLTTDGPLVPLGEVDPGKDVDARSPEPIPGVSR